jgi:hypothetical protein
VHHDAEPDAEELHKAAVHVQRLDHQLGAQVMADRRGFNDRGNAIRGTIAAFGNRSYRDDRGNTMRCSTDPFGKYGLPISGSPPRLDERVEVLLVQSRVNLRLSDQPVF